MSVVFSSHKHTTDPKLIGSSVFQPTDPKLEPVVQTFKSQLILWKYFSLFPKKIIIIINGVQRCYKFLFIYLRYAHLQASAVALTKQPYMADN